MSDEEKAKAGAGEGSSSAEPYQLLVSFRGTKHDVPCHPGMTVGSIKDCLITSSGMEETMTADDIKLVYRGKILADHDVDFYELLVTTMATTTTSTSKTGGRKKAVVKLMATGMSRSEVDQSNEDIREGIKHAPRIRDDLTHDGRIAEARRRQRGRKALAQAASRSQGGESVGGERYGFGRIETLPMLAEETKARDILTSLSNDPGILSCMAKHRWNVGCLAEMYPEGQVGKSEVCVMGLNQNKGQKILLRLRTDDLRGFRKILSIRKVLFHELAHNVHSEHDDRFFQLMRQVEQECNEMDWTQGSGGAVGGVGRATPPSGTIEDELLEEHGYSGGTGRLGGSSETMSRLVPAREMAARAAMMRWTAEEEEIRQHCGCGRFSTDDHDGATTSTNDSQQDATSQLAATTAADMDIDASETAEGESSPAG